jgi:hypothetical protein
MQLLSARIWRLRQVMSQRARLDDTVSVAMFALCTVLSRSTLLASSFTGSAEMLSGQMGRPDDGIESVDIAVKGIGGRGCCVVALTAFSTAIARFGFPHSYG